MAKHLEAIRDRNLPMPLFRQHSDVLTEYLVEQVLAKISPNRWSDIIPVLIFRASLVFLPSIIRKLRTSRIGFTA